MGMSYGFVEIRGAAAALDALDIMCKSADVKLITWERRWGGRLVTLIVGGEVSAVTEAVKAACARAFWKPAVHGVIANPHEEIVRLVARSAGRLRQEETDEEENR